jgi:hypothetical protein
MAMRLETAIGAATPRREGPGQAIPGSRPADWVPQNQADGFDPVSVPQFHAPEPSPLPQLPANYASTVRRMDDATLGQERARVEAWRADALSGPEQTPANAKAAEEQLRVIYSEQALRQIKKPGTNYARLVRSLTDGSLGAEWQKVKALHAGAASAPQPDRGTVNQLVFKLESLRNEISRRAVLRPDVNYTAALQGFRPEGLSDERVRQQQILADAANGGVKHATGAEHARLRLWSIRQEESRRKIPDPLLRRTYQEAITQLPQRILDLERRAQEGLFSRGGQGAELAQKKLALILKEEQARKSALEGHQPVDPAEYSQHLARLGSPELRRELEVANALMEDATHGSVRSVGAEQDAQERISLIRNEAALRALAQPGGEYASKIQGLTPQNLRKELLQQQAALQDAPKNASGSQLEELHRRLVALRNEEAVRTLRRPDGDYRAAIRALTPFSLAEEKRLQNALLNDASGGFSRNEPQAALARQRLAWITTEELSRSRTQSTPTDAPSGLGPADLRRMTDVQLGSELDKQSARLREATEQVTPDAEAARDAIEQVVKLRQEMSRRLTRSGGV